MEARSTFDFWIDGFSRSSASTRVTTGLIRRSRWPPDMRQVEQIEQLALIACLSTHHGKPPPLRASRRRNHCSPIIASTFFNSIGPQRT
jgi:hypothetical protein